jgi:hypothetical protein
MKRALMHSKDNGKYPIESKIFKTEEREDKMQSNISPSKAWWD